MFAHPMPVSASTGYLQVHAPFLTLADYLRLGVIPLVVLCLVDAVETADQMTCQDDIGHLIDVCDRNSIQMVEVGLGTQSMAANCPKTGFRLIDSAGFEPEEVRIASIDQCGVEQLPPAVPRLILHLCKGGGVGFDAFQQPIQPGAALAICWHRQRTEVHFQVLCFVQHELLRMAECLTMRRGHRMG